MVKQLAQPISRRQDAPKVYDMNASIYVWKKEVLMNSDSLFLERTKIYVMPEWAIDIDSGVSFGFVEFILKNRKV